MNSDTQDILNEIVKDVSKLTENSKDAAGESARLSISLTSVIAKIGNMESDLYDCVNELCLMCGSYQKAHEGACDSCRWESVKKKFREG